MLNSSVNFYIYLIKHGKREFRSIGLGDAGARNDAGTESTNFVTDHVSGITKL